MERRIDSALSLRIAPTPLNSTMDGCRSRRSTAAHGPQEPGQHISSSCRLYGMADMTTQF